ncbi:MAG: DMT family transporter, partial [Pseudomonadota bacterium]
RCRLTGSGRRSYLAPGPQKRRVFMAEAAPDRPTRAVLAIVGAAAVLSFGDALIKLTSSDFVLWQVFILRSGMAVLAFLGAALLMRVPLTTTSRQLFWGLVRSLLLVLMWLFYYATLPQMEFALAASVYYAAPILMALLSVAALGDQMTPLGWLAVALGFLGVIFILKPTGAGANAYALLPLLAAAFYAAAMVITRAKCRDDGPLMLAFLLHCTFVVVGVAGVLLAPALGLSGFLSASWTAMDAQDWLAMGVLAALALLGSIFAAIAYQSASPALVGTVDFSYIVFATIWGGLLFAEIPDALSSLGIALILVAGVTMARRGLRR